MLKKWFVLQYKTNSHQKALKNLNRQKYETFLPFCYITIKKNSQFIKVTKPLFPGYMFISFDGSNNNWNKINNTYGVSRLISFNHALRSLPSSFICDLINKCDASGNLIPTKKLKEGDRVNVLNNPFSDTVAIVESVDSDQRISILMDLMGRKTKVKTDANNLQYID